MVEPSDKSTSPLDPLGQRIREIVLELLSRTAQPTAWELLEFVEQQVGFKARWVMKVVLTDLADDRDLTKWARQYVLSLLRSGDLPKALECEVPPRKRIESTIDELLHSSLDYRNSEKFQELISFIARFKEYSPYNNMLVRLQNPTCTYFARQKVWYERFGRTLKEDARPMLILAPMHPVILVYDLDQTEGRPLPEELERFSQFEGEWDPIWLERVVTNAERHYHIKVDFKKLSTTYSGFATNACDRDKWKMRTVIHNGLDGPSCFGVLCHELAHILLGHLGCEGHHWWPSRMGINRHAAEIEAEACAYIVTTRFRLEGTSSQYLSRYLIEERLPGTVSLDMIAKVASRIERMALDPLSERKH